VKISSPGPGPCLGPAVKRRQPGGDDAKKSLPVYRFHSARRSMRNVPFYPLDISVVRDKVVFNLSEQTANIWMTTLGAG
jgi:hypothetical protein